MKMFVKDKKGIALIACYLVIVVLTILGGAFLARSISEKRIAERERDAIQAFWLAEAGLQACHKGLRQNWAVYTTNLPRINAFNQTFGIGSFTVDIDSGPPLPDTIRVTSKGTAGTAVMKTLEEIIKGTVSGGLPGFDFAALAAGNLHLDGSGTIENRDVYVNGNLDVHSPDAIKGGDAHVVGNVTLKGEGSSLTGNVNAGGKIHVHPGTTITGNAAAEGNITNDGTITGTSTPYAGSDTVDEAAIQAKADSYKLSSQDWDTYKAQAQAGGNYHEGAFRPSGSYTGIHYVTGTLTIDSNISGTATFVVEGNVEFKSGNVDMDPASGSDYSFVIGGNVRSTNTASGTLGGVIYTEGNFYIKTAITIDGAVICYGNLHGSGDFNIKSPVAGTTLEILSWKEL